VRRSAAVILIAAAGCARAPGDARPGGSAAPPAASFSREAFAPRASDAGAAEVPVEATADPAALDEIVAAAPKLAPRTTTGPDGGTTLGADTGVREDTPAPEAAATGRRATSVRVGKPVVEPNVSGQAIEQAARAQLYWGLTQRCRGPEGKILPPEVVHLVFQLDGDGYLVPPTVLSVPKEERFAAAARCMARELAATTFRAPPAARGRPQTVQMDVPSVD
jgi:hypothetical protein